MSKHNPLSKNRTPSSLFVSRTFLQVEHMQLLEHMDPFNRRWPDITIQWRRLGRLGVMLLQNGEYQSFIREARGSLYSRSLRRVADALNQGVLSSCERTQIPLKAAEFLGHNTATYVHVGYAIEPEYLADERQEITAELNNMNRVPGAWRHSFKPFISLATLNRHSAAGEVLFAFQDIMPQTATLLQPVAQTN